MTYNGLDGNKISVCFRMDFNPKLLLEVLRCFRRLMNLFTCSSFADDATFAKKWFGVIFNTSLRDLVVENVGLWRRFHDLLGRACK